MNLLVIDSAADYEIIALSVNGKTHDASSYTGNAHSRMMFGEMNALMDRAMIRPRDLDAIGVGVGPGSFTGIRLAVSAARALAQVNGIPLFTAPTPLVYAQSFHARSGSIVIPSFDAKKGRVFGAAYRITADILNFEEIVQPGDYPMEELCRKVTAGAHIIAAGDGCGKYLTALNEAFGRVEFDPSFTPDSAAALAYFTALYGSGARPHHNDALPLYTRKSDAEVLLDLKNNTKG